MLLTIVTLYRRKQKNIIITKLFKLLLNLFIFTPLFTPNISILRIFVVIIINITIIIIMLFVLTNHTFDFQNASTTVSIS